MTRPALQLVDGEADRIGTAEQVAAEQITAARKLLTRDLSKAARWEWRELDAVVGPMLAGNFVVVGSLMGNGKSTLLMSQMDAFASRQMPVLYVPMEVDPEECRLNWAAWALELDRAAVMRQDWLALPRGAQQALDLTLQEQPTKYPYLHFAPPRRLTLQQMEKWCRWARLEFDAKVIMIDHLHRLDFGSSGANYRVSATDIVRRIKDLGRELGVVMLAAAQLNRNTTDPIDPYTPPHLGRLKETAAIAEEADVVLMLSRKLRRDLPDNWEKDLRLNRITENDLADRNVMVVTCRKHRLDDRARDARVQLQLNNGRIIGGRV